MNIRIRQDQNPQQHIHALVLACQKFQSASKAILLYGSYGRDEGGWFQNEQGTWCPYNDYDICIVTEEKSHQADLKALGNSLAEEIGIRWIDIGMKTPSELSRLRPTIYNYDLKHGSKVIDGDASVLELIPDFDPASLSMQEAQTLFFTRLYTFLGSLDAQGVDQNLQGEASRFFRNQMAKATLAVVDVLLLARGAYDSSYRRRVEKVAAIYPEKKEFLALSRWALNEKLRPQAPDMSAQEVCQMYEEALQDFFD